MSNPLTVGLSLKCRLFISQTLTSLKQRRCG